MVFRAKKDFNWYKVKDLINEEDLVHKEMYLRNHLIEDDGVDSLVEAPMTQALPDEDDSADNEETEDGTEAPGAEEIVWDETKLLGLNAFDQRKMLSDLGATRSPRLEAGRVKLILSLLAEQS